jgi:hypothetical protein
MPTTLEICPVCSKAFQSSRGLSMHLYHFPNTCGRQPITTGIPEKPKDVLDPDSDSSPEPMNFDDDPDDDDDMPFELSRSELEAMSGETDTVIHSLEQKVHVDLLHILQKAEVPDYLFQDVVEWASRSRASGYNFSPALISRPAVLNNIRKHLKLHELRPTISELKLESVDQHIPIVTFDFYKLLISILTEVTLMQPENLVINPATEFEDGSIDVRPWFKPFHPTNTSLNEVLSGKWYNDTVEQLGAAVSDSKIFVCPLIFYVDRTHIDSKSRFNLEPVNFTLGIFKQSKRTQVRFWRTLGFLPDIPEEDVHNPAKGCKTRNYHTMLKHILQGALDLQKDPSRLDNFPLRIGNHVHHVNLRIPVAFVISDTQGADKLCGRYISYNDSIQRLHRSCRCTPMEASDHNHVCEWVEMEDMMKIIDRADPHELQQFSQHRVPDCAFRTMDFGCNKFGIYGATPFDILHGIKLGIVEYVLEVFLNKVLSPQACHNLDQVLKSSIQHLRQGGNKNFPRMYFPNGITTIKKTTGEEKIGIMFMIYLMCSTQTGKNAISQTGRIGIAVLNNYMKVFCQLLLFYAWMSRSDGYWELENLRGKRRASKAIRDLMLLITTECHRAAGQGWNISKLHELLHVTTFIELFGAPSNYDAGPCERMHQDVAKKPGRSSQKRHATFTKQAAERLADSLLIEHAYNHIVVLPNLEETDPVAIPKASKFVIDIATNPENFQYECKVNGLGVLSRFDLQSRLMPGLVEFIVAFHAQYYSDRVPRQILCSSEAADEDGNVYRAHQNYRGGGFWHDWAMASFLKNEETEEFADVPVKILSFLPLGLPGNETVHVVCHPCKWRCLRPTPILNEWKLVPETEATMRGIPYDIIPISALTSHCLILPDVDDPGVVFEVISKAEWADKFITNHYI